MNSLLEHIGAAGPNWIQHNLPWLGVLAFLFGLSRESDDRRDNADNG